MHRTAPYPRPRAATDAGMTLIEIMVVLGIIGLMLLLLPAMFKRVTKSDLKSDARRVAAAMRSGYDRASSTAAHHRLVIDLEADTYWLERCEGSVRMVRSIDEDKAQEQQAILAQLARPPDTGAVIPGMAQPTGDLAANVAPPPSLDSSLGAGTAEMPCAPVKGKDIAGPQRLTDGRGISFKQVWVSHLEDPVAEGKVTINFFPSGRAERAVLTLADGDDTTFSIRLHALTGRVDIKSGEIKRADEIVAGEERVP